MIGSIRMVTALSILPIRIHLIRVHRTFRVATCLDDDNDGVANNGTPTTVVPVEPNPAADNDPCVPSNTARCL